MGVWRAVAQRWEMVGSDEPGFGFCIPSDELLLGDKSLRLVSLLWVTLLPLLPTSLQLTLQVSVETSPTLQPAWIPLCFSHPRLRASHWL